MNQLASIPDIGETSLELLEAAGFTTLEAIADADAEALSHELDQANSVLNITTHTPGLTKVAGWVETARELVGQPADDGEGSEGKAGDNPDKRPTPVNYEETEEVAKMLMSAPFAIPLPARVLVQNRLGVSDIPPAILLNRYSGDLDVRVNGRSLNKEEKEKPNGSGLVRLADDPRHPQQKLEIDVSKVRTMDEMGEPLKKMPAVKASPSNDRLALLRAPRADTNKGKNPNSRRYIRGVLHSHPVSIYLGALVTLLVMVWIPVAILSSALLFLSSEIPDKFGWVPGWLLAFPAILPLLGIAYLIWGIQGACRICGQRLFVHRSHLKNIKAHRIRGLGYVLPLCIHILLFRWFRCTHCGTPVRLKE